MKFLIVIFALIAAAFAAPQYVPIQPFGFGGGMSGSSANAAASSQSFNTGGYPGGFGYPGFGGGMSGSSANAAAGTQSFNVGK
jgi:uncharacterized membrane protein